MSGKKPESSPLLTDRQRSLLRGAVRSDDKSKPLTASQRQAIREIRVALGGHAKKPEQLLVAFKSSLSEAANDAKLLLGEERAALFVTAFIEELYKSQETIETPANGESRGSRSVEFTPAKTPGLSDARL